MTTAIFDAGGAVSLTQGQWNTMASWGVGAVVLGITYPYGFGGSAVFNGGSGNTTQNQYAAAAVLAHNAGIKLYFGMFLQNYNWGTVNTTNPAPLLGNWDPSFTDANGHGWGTYSGGLWTAGSYNAMAYNVGQAIAQMNYDGMFWDTEGGGIGSGSNPGSDYMIWQWRYYGNGYGKTSSRATEFANAQTAGANFMAAINEGFAAQGYNAAIPGSQVPILTYQSTVAGLPQLLNGYLDVWGAYTGNTVGDYIYGSGTVQRSYHTSIGDSTWTSFLTGAASETTGPIVLGDATFYSYQIVTSGGPYSGDADGGWARALAADAAALAALSLGANVHISPFIWPYDADSANGGAGIWSQAQWNKAVGPIVGAAQGGMYAVFQYTKLTIGGVLVNYADNTYNSSPNINYTPLGGIPTPTAAASAVGDAPTITVGPAPAAAAVSAAGVNPTVTTSLIPSPPATVLTVTT